MLRFLKKKRPLPVVMLFAEPERGLDLARRIARRQTLRDRTVQVNWMMNDFCSQQEGSAGNGGELKSAVACPGSPSAAGDRMAGAGCNVLNKMKGDQ